MRHIQARNYTKCAKRDIRLLVVHTMESPEKPTTAEAVAGWFAGPNAPRASAHYCIDNNSVVQCVYDHDIAWAAPNANHQGLHLEHAGRAAQRSAGWSDAYSLAELHRSARLAAVKSHEYGIPVRKLTFIGLRLGRKGFCGHRDVTKAWPKSGDHMDPGADFPWRRYLDYVKTYKAGKVPSDL